MSRHRALQLDAASYRPHLLHNEQQVWVEKNCYIDVWIELLHALGCEPRAMLPFTLAVDFEGDHWTFFKPPHGELRALYGVDVQELNVYRPLAEHAAEHLEAGKFISTEADAWWLPDTSGTDYRRQHTKTTVVLNDLDLERGRLGYFHNAGYHELEGEDFRRLLRMDPPDNDPAVLPLFAELVRVDALVRRPEPELAALCAGLLREHLARRPRGNPVHRFAQRFERDMPRLVDGGLERYHAWAFSTLRQLGAAFDLASACLRWLAPHHDEAALGAAAQHFDAIAQGSKAMVLKLARAVNARRRVDAAELFDEMARHWEAGMQALAR